MQPQHQLRRTDYSPDVTAISGSTSLTSSSTRLLVWIATRLAHEGRCVATVLVSQIPGEALLSGDPLHPALVQPIRWVATARAVVLAAPVMLASYSGALKLFLDALPSDALRDKLVLPVATGAANGRAVPLDSVLVPELTLLGARHVLPTVFIADDDVRREDAFGSILPIMPRARIERALTALDRGLGLPAGSN
jgi:FMN reductase